MEDAADVQVGHHRQSRDPAPHKPGIQSKTEEPDSLAGASEGSCRARVGNLEGPLKWYNKEVLD